MSNEVWYRKWRPQRFDDVAGQEHVTRTLANAVAAKRVAHAYLFCGPRGTGKTSTARILAKAANCEQNEAGEPCNHCSSCKAVAEGRALDLVEMDAASNRGIDEIRSLRDRVGYSPTSSMYKVYLIDEVHELTQHAFDALLKTLEEPPPHVIFALATTEAERVPATIVSRCQRYDFRRIRVVDVVGRLQTIVEQEQVQLPSGALELIARKATGSLRDAVNLLEQVVASGGVGPSLEQVRDVLGLGGDSRAAALVRHALAGELAPAFGTIAAARVEGTELRQLHRATLGHLRMLLLVQAGAEATLEIGDEAVASLREEAALTDTAAVLRLLRLLAGIDFRADPLSPLPLELALAESVHGSAIGNARVAADGPSAHPRRPPASAPAQPPARPAQEPVQPSRQPTTPPRIGSRPVPDLLRQGAARGPIQPEPPLSQPTRTASERVNDSALAPEAPQPVTEATATEDPRPSTDLPSPPFVDTGGSLNSADLSALSKAAGLPATSMSLEQMQELMGVLYDRLREQGSKAAASFVNSDCNIIDVDANSLTLAFKYESVATKFKSQDGGQRLREVEDVIEGLCGQKYVLHVDVDPEVARWRRSPVTAGTSHLLDEAEKLGLRRIERSRSA
ncbi:MAG: DNA polymerase III subunit gamma/tau [Dehalococcoidia bacterium]